jgi:GTPase
MKERAVLVTFDADGELGELAKASGLEAADTLICRLREPNVSLYLGRGKAEEIAGSVKSAGADTVVFDTDLSPSQQRNLEEIVGVKTIDRTQLILDIFARRARSTEARLQVELAQLKYLLPRLGGQGIYLSRLGGGVGTRGPGEQKLEVDRRKIRERIARLGREFAGLDRRRVLAIEKKKRKEWPLVALVGYTNAGKSTLFNRLTDAGVLVKDQLFSTLDTTTRLLNLPGNQKAMLVDTVGFVKKLPHHLVESFKATLEEAVHADILLHVVDASRPDPDLAREAVEEVLNDLGVDPDKVRLVWNKADLLTDGIKPGPLLVSALTGRGVQDLRHFLSGTLGKDRLLATFFVPKNRLGLSGLLYKQTEVLERKDGPEGSTFKVRVLPGVQKMLEKKAGLQVALDS